MESMAGDGVTYNPKQFVTEGVYGGTSVCHHFRTGFFAQ